ncbi:MAG: two-component system, OmpR family, sensor kinase [Frankiales bacterium]|jgi:signal transduction histidine kinase|nr:two-component system, OmpR family, sensor kinase [Frankiales bacterium]
MRTGLLIAWLILGAVPLLWWVWTRRRTDIWRALPVPTALLDPDGNVRAVTGPDADTSFTLNSGVPAKGRIVRTHTNDGTPLAVAGVRGGALAVALPADPVTERRDRVLAELGSRLAHDINTPLSALHGHLDLIAHEPISANAQESVRTCQRELQRLQTTAQDLLMFTRLRAGAGRQSQHLIGALVEESVAALLLAADERGADLSVEVPAGRVLVQAAEGDLVRALRNLISNALTYGLGERRDVRVVVDADEDAVTVSVLDSGPGLTAEQIAAFSEPLRRGETGSTPGSGLGLAIVAEVLTAHGSKLEPSKLGPGVSFTLARIRP